MGLCELQSENNILLLILTALVNYSKIIAFKYKTINGFEKYIYNDTKKIKYLICWHILCTLRLEVCKNPAARTII